MSRRARKMEAAAPHSPAEKEARRRAAEQDAAERDRARRDFKANQVAQRRLRAYEKIKRKLDKKDSKQRAKIDKQIADLKRELEKRKK